MGCHFDAEFVLLPDSHPTLLPFRLTDFILCYIWSENLYFSFFRFQQIIEIPAQNIWTVSNWNLASAPTWFQFQRNGIAIFAYCCYTVSMRTFGMKKEDNSLRLFWFSCYTHRHFRVPRMVEIVMGWQRLKDDPNFPTLTSCHWPTIRPP